MFTKARFLIPFILVSGLICVGCGPTEFAGTKNKDASGGSGDLGTLDAQGGDTDGNDGDTGGVDTGSSNDDGGDGGDSTGTADTGGGTTDGGGSTDGGSSGGPVAEEVDPDCIDGQYSETLPNVTVNISSEVSSFSAAKYQDFVLAVLDKRYPVGAWLAALGQKNQQMGDCIEIFIGPGKSSASEAVKRLSTVVHECGHFADIAAGGFSESAYLMTQKLTLSCKGGNSIQQGGSTFARSLLLNDKFSVAHPPCKGGSFQGCDSYATIYLDGDPNNSQFEGGDQGFSMLLEEVVQYINSLATGYAFSSSGGNFFASSNRDGILNFLWFLERYLYMARTQYPQAYSMLTSTCWRRAILTVWGRAWLYLEATKGINKLGIQDGKILELVRTPELLEEIQKLRDIEGC